MSDNFTIADWAKNFEITEDSLKILADKGFASRLTLSKLTPEIIKAEFKKLPLAQNLLLQEACQSLRVPETVTQPTEPATPAHDNGGSGDASSGSTLTAADVAAFIDQGGSIISDKNDCGKPHLFDPLQFDFNKSGAVGPHRDIRDYITLVPKGLSGSAQDSGSIKIGAQEFLLKDTKIPWERLNVPQYMEGSLRIMREMALQDKCGVGELLEYSNYLVKIATLGQCFNWQSVLKYDQAYRKAQSSSGFRWGSDNSYLMQLYLKPETYDKPQQPYQKKQAKAPAKGKTYKFDPETGSQICMKWNSVGGCKFPDCKFAHTCMKCYSTAHAQHSCKPPVPVQENS